jgi:hypothetical protein
MTVGKTTERHTRKRTRKKMIVHHEESKIDERKLRKNAHDRASNGVKAISPSAEVEEKSTTNGCTNIRK